MTREISTEELSAVEELLGLLGSLVKNHAVYGAAHPRSGENLDAYLAQCRATMALTCVEKDRVIIACRQERLYLENLPLSDSNPQLRVFVEKLKQKEKSGFVLRLGLRGDALSQVLEQLNPGRESKSEPVSDHLRWLTRGELLELERSHFRTRVEDHVLFRIPELHVDKQDYEFAINELASFTEQCAEDDGFKMEGIDESARSLVEKMLASPSELMPMTTIPYHDEFTYYHSVNVCVLTLFCARAIVDDEEQLLRICKAALLHDVGKARISREILYKNGPLDDEEREIIMQHPVTGAQILESFSDIDALAVAVAFGHHIKDNGTGYPKTVPGYRMGPVTQLVEVCDIFEALTAVRPYKKPLAAAQAFEILYSMPNMQSMRKYMDLLFQVVGSQPLGSRVRTADGELGVVCGRDEQDPEKALVRLVQKDEATGELHTDTVVVAYSDPQKLSKEEDSEEWVSTLVSAIDPEEDLEATVGAT